MRPCARPEVGSASPLQLRLPTAAAPPAVQEAAGAFAFLRDEASLKMDAPRPADLGPEAAAMLERLMLAQAQECVFEKALADKKSPALLAR